MNPRRRWRGVAGGLLGPLAVVVAVAAGYGQLVVGRLLRAYDVVTYSLPNRVQVSRALRGLHLPLWDPYRFAGVPLLANPQTAVLYPPHWALAFMAPDRAQDVSMVLHVTIAAVGVYAFARRALQTSRLAAATAGAAFALGGCMNVRVSFYEQITAIAWVPWALTGLDAALAAPGLRSAARPIAGTALAVTMCALAGHTQFVHMTVVALGVYAVVTVRPWRRVWRAAVAVALGAAGAAAQLVPTAALAARSTRSGGLSLAAASELALPRRAAAATFLPEYLKTPRLGPPEHWAWTAVAVLALTVVAVAGGRCGRRQLALLVLAVSGALMAVGDSTPVYRIAFRVLPGLSSFRVPSRWLLLPSLALPLLAAVGLDAVRAGARPTRWTFLAVAAAGAFAAIVSLTPARPDARSLVVGGALAIVVLFAWLLAWRRPRFGLMLAGGVVVIVGCELAAADVHVPVRDLRMDANVVTHPSEVAAAVGRPGGRVLSIGGEQRVDELAMRAALWPNTQVYDRLRSVDGYDGGLLVGRGWDRAMAAFVGRTDFDFRRNVRGSLGPPLSAARFAELDITRVVVRDAPFDVTLMLPRGSAQLGAINGIEIWSTPSRGPVFTADGRAGAGLRLERDDHHPERLVARVPAALGGRTLVVSEGFAPGWHASGGVTIHRYHDLLMSFRAPRRGGTVVLRYTEPGLVPAAAVSLAALAIAVALLVWGRGARSVSV